MLERCLVAHQIEEKPREPSWDTNQERPGTFKSLPQECFVQATITGQHHPWAFCIAMASPAVPGHAPRLSCWTKPPTPATTPPSEASNHISSLTDPKPFHHSLQLKSVLVTQIVYSPQYAAHTMDGLQPRIPYIHTPSFRGPEE